MEIFNRKRNLNALLLCLAGVALNLLLWRIAALLSLPLYLDTVGTIAVAVMGGYLPGVLVGFVTNVINSIVDPTSVYYGALSVLIAIFATYLSGKGWFKKPQGMFERVERICPEQICDEKERRFSGLGRLENCE